MPRSPRSPCAKPGCPNLAGDAFCADHRNEASKRFHAHQKFYGSKRWRMLRQQVLREQPWCAVAGCPNPATEVDHIVPLRDGGPELARTNVQGLCAKHHGQKTNEEVYGRKS